MRVPSVNFQNLPPVKKSSTIKSWPTFCDQYFWKFPIWNSRTDEKRREIRMVKVNVIFMTFSSCTISPSTKKFSPNFEGPFRQLSKSSAREKIKYNKILTYILRSIFLEIPHLELLCWRKTPRDTNGKGECHIYMISGYLTPLQVNWVMVIN